MLLSELLETPELALRVLHSGSGLSTRQVRRTVTTDLRDPGRYVAEGDLVLSSLVWHRRAADSERFVAAVVGRGVCALLAGSAHLEEVPADLVDACRRHGLTLAEVPVEVDFADIADHVASHDASGAGRASTALVRQRELLTAIASGRTLDELAARVSREIGHECRIITPTGRHVVPGPQELDDPTLDTLTREFLVAERLPVACTPHRSPHSLFAIGPGLGNRLTSWILVVEGDHRAWPRDHVDAVHELCAIAALDRSRREERLRATRPIAAEAWELLESGAPQAEIAGRVRQSGLDPTAPLVVALASMPSSRTTGGSAPDDPGALLEDVALAVGHQVPATTREGLAVALLPSTPDLPDLVRSALNRLAPGVGRRTLSVGLSAGIGVEALSGALEEARFAHRVACASGASISVVGSDDVTSHVLLLATVPDDVRRTFGHRLLGRVIDHDERNRGDLVATLAAFLAQSGSWTRTAEELHLHVNTVRYRIERVQTLTGRDLSRLEDRVDLFLALKSI